MNDVGVVILSYGSGNQQTELVDSLVSDGIALGRILVVHNPDGTRAGARPLLRPGVASRVLLRNEGYGGAMNAGIEYWLAEQVGWVLLLTHDARFAPGGLAKLLNAGEADATHGVLGPVLVRSDTGRPYSYGGVDARENIVLHREQRPEQHWNGIADCAWVDGTVMLVRAKAYQQAGPIDARFFMYFEEPDFCMRIRRVGWGVGVALEATAITAPGQTERPLAYGYLFCRNGLRYAWRSGGARRLATAVESQLRMTSYLASKPYNRRFYDPTFRRFGWSVAVGIWLGLIAAGMRRWGPPPSWVQRLTDIGGA